MPLGPRPEQVVVKLSREEFMIADILARAWETTLAEGMRLAQAVVYRQMRERRQSSPLQSDAIATSPAEGSDSHTGNGSSDGLGAIPGAS